MRYAYDVEAGFLDEIVRDYGETVILEASLGEHHQRDGTLALDRERDGAAGRLEDRGVGHRRVLSEWESAVRRAERPARTSDVEAELHHVAVVHDVFLALEARLAAVTGLED